MTFTQSHSRARPIPPFDRIHWEHEQLRVVLSLAQRCAANAERDDCAQMLQRALRFLEDHSRSEEGLLTRCAYEGIHGVRRDHERLIVALEQTLAQLEQDDPCEVADMLRRVGEFLANSVARDTQSMARFFLAMIPGRTPAPSG